MALSLITTINDQTILHIIPAATDDDVREIFDAADQINRSIIMRCLEEHGRHTLVDHLAIKYPSQRLHESTVHRICSASLSRGDLTTAMGVCSRGMSRDAARDIIRWVNDHDVQASFMPYLYRNTYPFTWSAYIVEAIIDMMLGRQDNRQDDPSSVARVAALRDIIPALLPTIIDVVNKWGAVYPTFMNNETNAIIVLCDMEILDIFVDMAGVTTENLLSNIISCCVWLASSSVYADITPTKSMTILRHILGKYPEAIHSKKFTVCSNCCHREIIEFMYEHSSHDDIDPIDMCADSLLSSACVRFLVDVGYLMRPSSRRRYQFHPLAAGEYTARSVAILIRSGFHDLFEWYAVSAAVARGMINDGYLPYMSVFDGIMCESGRSRIYQVNDIAAAYVRRNRIPTAKEGSLTAISLADVTITTID